MRALLLSLSLLAACQPHDPCEGGCEMRRVNYSNGEELGDLVAEVIAANGG